MNPKNLILENLKGIWRSTEKENNYFDLSFTESGKFLYDEILDGDRIISSSRMGDPKFQPGENPVLTLKDLELKIFMFDENEGEIFIEYPDGIKRKFHKVK